MTQLKWVHTGFIILMGIAVLLFFALAYPHHLHFQEQYQLFLYDADYIKDILSVPGGLADLIGRFVTQFFVLAWAGATIVALLLVTVACLCARLIFSDNFKGLCLLPVVLLFAFLTDENSLLGSILAIFLSLCSHWGISAIRHKWVRLSVLLLSAPVLYGLLGPVALLVSLLHLIISLRSQQKTDVWGALLSAFIFMSMPVIAHQFIALSLDNLYFSPHYYRYPYMRPIALWMAVLSVLAVASLPKLKTARWITFVGWISMLAVGGVVSKIVYNPTKEQVMAYDYMARFQQWNRILETADKRLPNNSVSCTALNLALGKKGRLADRMFEYNQNGLSGLLPVFERDAVSPLVTSEAFYQLGMINTAQRFVFEAQEAIPDFQKSARCYKRLAETNLINGNYEVSKKYLIALSKTLIYRSWALETLALLGNEEAINKHQEYGRLRQFRPVEDFWFSDAETPQMLGQLFMSNRSNKLAYEYLQAAFLLERDIDAFARCLELGASLGYQQMPLAFQQAFILWWSRDHRQDEPMPKGLSQNLIAGMNQFYAMVKSKTVNPDLLFSRFGNTYWYYYFYSK